MKKPRTLGYKLYPLKRKALAHTVSNSDSFPIFFSECSSHFCQVIIHPTVRQLRASIPRKLNREPGLESGTVAHLSPNDSLIATIHLCREALVCSHICHECLHAAWHRAKLLGIKDDDDFQEFTAYGQAELMVQIADWITSQNQFLARSRKQKGLSGELSGRGGIKVPPTK